MRWPFLRSERKAAEQVRIFDWIDNGLTGSVIRVSPEQALGVALVFAARRVIAEDVAKLPAHLKRRDGTGRTIAETEPEHRILSAIGKAPSGTDDGFTAMEWIEAIVADAALPGRGVAHLNRVGGRVVEVTPIPRDRWREERGRWFIAWEPGRWEPVDRADLMVLRGPVLGANVTRYAGSVINLAMHMDKLMLSLARKGGRPNGIVSMDGLAAEQAATFVERMRRWFGPSGDGGLMPVDGVSGLNFHRVSLTPQELETDATWSAISRQIAAAFRVQPSRLMHEMSEQTHASAYQFNIAHVNDTIQPWAKRFRQTFDKDVLGAERATRFYCDLELKGLLQGAPKDRADFLLKLRTMGALSPQGVAELEDLDAAGLSDDPAFPLLTNPNPAKEAQTDA